MSSPSYDDEVYGGRKMCCGLGKCGHWKMDESYICLDGPVYDYSKAKTLID